MILKVCGMREGQNIRAVEQTGIDWLGFICYAGSPRFVSVRPSYLPVRAKAIGVFVDAPLAYIRQCATNLDLWGVQLHGSESPELCDAVHRSGLKVIKALGISAKADLRAARAYEGHADYLLFDTRTAGHGGSGRSFNWSVLNAYRGRTPFLLSGGLRPESLSALRAFSHPRLVGYDLNSGFETAPAVKDAALIARFVEALRTSGVPAETNNTQTT